MNKFLATAVLTSMCGLGFGCQSELETERSQHEIWGGSEDFEHTAVVSVNQEGPAGWYNICSGTLIAPDVVLTAAHCTYGATRMAVAFAQDIAPGWPVPASIEQHVGTAISHPGYLPQAVSPQNTDMGVIILDTPVADVSPMALPSAGAAAALRNHDDATIVGFGMASALGLGSGGGLAWTDERRQADVHVVHVAPGFIQFTPNFGGNGGACFGDSGGASLVDLGAGEVVAGVTIIGDGSCIQLAQSARTDTEVARGFLGQFLTLP